MDVIKQQYKLLLPVSGKKRLERFQHNTGDYAGQYVGEFYLGEQGKLGI